MLYLKGDTFKHPSFLGFGYQFVKFQGRNPTNQTVAPENRRLVLPEKERPGPFSKHQFSSGFSAVGFREGKFLKNTILKLT